MFAFFDSMPKLIRMYEQAVAGDNLVNIMKYSNEMVELIEKTTKKLVDIQRKWIRGES